MSDPTPPAGPANVLYRSWPRPDGPSRVEYLSAGAEAAVEATASELADRLYSRTLPLWGCDPAAFYDAVFPAAAAGKPWHAEVGYRTPRTGRELWVQATAFPQVAADGTPYYLGTFLDVTARRAAELAEREAADRLAAHVANTPLAVIEWDQGMRVSRWNGAAEALFGWTNEEVLGLTLGDFPLVHPDDAERVAVVGRRLSTGEERRNVVFNRNRHKSGRALACEWHNCALYDDAGAVRSVLSLVLDRTPAADAQAAVARSEARLRAALQHANMLGWEHDLEAGTAHHSGDRAAFYGGEGEGDLVSSVIHPADRDRFWQAVVAAGRSGRPLAVEYRGLARTSDGRPRWYVDRGQVAADVAGRPVRMVGVTAEITDRVHAADDRAALDRELLTARRRPTLDNVTHDLNNTLVTVLADLQTAADLLTDHPAGVPVQSALTACWRMVDSLRGPATPAPRAVSGWRGAGRALVADDEPNVRELVAALLEEAGFEVTRVADGPSALTAFHADPAAYRLVVADILMPGLEGDELVSRLRAARPGLPALLMTGFLTRPINPAVLNAPATRLLTKPFRVEHLQAAAQAVCEATV